jgi:hypothetical protein
MEHSTHVLLVHSTTRHSGRWWDTARAVHQAAIVRRQGCHIRLDCVVLATSALVVRQLRHQAVQGRGAQQGTTVLLAVMCRRHVLLAITVALLGSHHQPIHAVLVTTAHCLRRLRHQPTQARREVTSVLLAATAPRAVLLTPHAQLGHTTHRQVPTASLPASTALEEATVVDEGWQRQVVCAMLVTTALVARPLRHLHSTDALQAHGAL